MSAARLFTTFLAALATGWLTVSRAHAEPCARSVLTERQSDELRFRDSESRALRGMTIGPIESALHPERGYGSPAFERALSEAQKMGATWISLTPFGRVLDLSPTGVALSFEQPFVENQKAVRRAIAQAHARGLCVLLVPHLWVESGGWRAEIEAGDDAAWERWAKGYTEFVRAWAEVARDAHADMLSAGVELRSWVTTARAASFGSVLRELRRIYPGPLTYAANWDDAEQTVIWGDLDVIGINAFYPLAEKDGATAEELAAGGRDVARRVNELSKAWQKPVMFSEFGYTTRSDPAVRPWEWPDFMANVRVDQLAQAEAYAALLAPLLDEPAFIGAFVWRVYADPDDLSQEAEWGFSPRGKLAELLLRDAFAAYWAADGPRRASPFAALPAERVGVY
ncbi:MAG TPA: hypothetical protein VG937_25800 [Polyangiaceae bacterium]|jgi:hypothetical protein|nr:hypothetical protein [Polyangiaceae bacterium]